MKRTETDLGAAERSGDSLTLLRLSYRAGKQGTTAMPVHVARGEAGPCHRVRFACADANHDKRCWESHGAECKSPTGPTVSVLAVLAAYCGHEVARGLLPEDSIEGEKALVPQKDDATDVDREGNCLGCGWYLLHRYDCDRVTLPDWLTSLGTLLEALPDVVVEGVACGLCDGKGYRDGWNGDHLECEHSKCIDGTQKVKIPAVRYVMALCALEAGREAYREWRRRSRDHVCGGAACAECRRLVSPCDGLGACEAWTICPCPTRGAVLVQIQGVPEPFHRLLEVCHGGTVVHAAHLIQSFDALTHKARAAVQRTVLQVAGL